MIRLVLLTFVLCLTISCSISKKEKVDLIVYNAVIYTADQNFSIGESMAIKDGVIVEVGTSREVRQKYSSSSEYDAKGKAIFPGFIDAHAHFYGYGSNLQSADLRNKKSFDEVLKELEEFAKTHKEGFLLGRGWDQNLWDEKEFPSNEKLNQLFKDRPVYLVRVDGHAALVNYRALELAGINDQTRVQGGEILKKDGKLQGVLIDNAMSLVRDKIGAPSVLEIEKSLKDAQQYSFAAGLTTVVDAGLDYQFVDIIEKMQAEKELKIRLSVMLSDSKENLDYLVNRGKIKTPKLSVQGFKFYGDGALGSRGACLLDDYFDMKGHRGFLLKDKSYFSDMAKVLYDHGFQMNTHAIGDSTNREILEVYAQVLKGKNDLRWRIEHAQIVSPEDLGKFNQYSIIPSVQPTHATSDMIWAKDRLGPKKIETAYAYKNLLRQNGYLPLGTDFPVEDLSPIKTFYAAVARKNLDGYPEGGFQPENSLSRKEAILGMTIWAAKGSFLEKEVGSLEKGKIADFIVLDRDLMSVPLDHILDTKILRTYVDGNVVYNYEELRSGIKL